MSAEPETTDQSVEELVEELYEQNQQLVDRIETLEEQHEQVTQTQDKVTNLVEQYATGRIGRRTFLTLLGGIGMTGALIGRATAHSASPSWGSATGTMGEESTPLDRAWIRDGHFKELHTEEVNSNTVQTGEADIKNETLVSRGLTSNDRASINSNIWAQVTFSDADLDARGEYDGGSDQFSPDVSGWYMVLSQVLLNDGGTSEGLSIRLRNVTDSASVSRAVLDGVDTSGIGTNMSLSGVFELFSGKNYEVQVRNSSSSDRIWDDPGHLSIRSVFKKS